MLQRGTAKRVAVIALGIMTLALAAIGIVILIQVQNQQDPEDSLAYGFGSSAIRDNFVPVELAFATYPCYNFLRPEYLQNTGNTLLDSMGTKYIRALDRPTESEFNIPKNCYYTFNDTSAIEFRVKTYATDAVIDDSAEELYERVNKDTLAAIVEEGEFEESIVYFFGTRKEVNGQNFRNGCVANLFHRQNDFEFAAIYYEAVGPCTELVEPNRLLVGIFANGINDIMKPFLIPNFGLATE